MAQILAQFDLPDCHAPPVLPDIAIYFHHRERVLSQWSAMRKCVLSSALFWRVKVPLAVK